MATTRYHRWVVMASVIRLLTSSIPTLLAVSKPKVGMPPGSGRSLSMVFGTCATRRPPPAAPASRDAENAVSSPPIVTSAPIPSFRSDSRQACSRQSGSAAPSSRTVGLAREVRMIDPPWTWILDTSVMDSGRASSTRPAIRCSKPSMIPTTSQPEFRASIVAAEMTEFIPGAGPPPHKIPSFTSSSSQPRGDPGKRSHHQQASGHRDERAGEVVRLVRDQVSDRLPGVKSERGSVLDGCDRQVLDRSLLLCRTLPTIRRPERGRRSRDPEAEVCSQPIPHQV